MKASRIPKIEKEPWNVPLGKLTRQERIFVLAVCVLGMTATDAFATAFSDSKASRASMAVRSCVLLRDERLQEAMETLRAYADLKLFKFTDRRRRD
jgi:hypothetical protein